MLRTQAILYTTVLLACLVYSAVTSRDRAYNAFCVVVPETKVEVWGGRHWKDTYSCSLQNALSHLPK